MNSNKAWLIGIPGAIVAIIALFGMAQENPQTSSEISIPLWLLTLALLGSFGLGILAKYLPRHKSRGGTFVVSAGYSKLGRQLRDKYGEGFNDDDELMIEAARKGHQTVDELAIYTNLPKKLIKERIRFMEAKEIDEATFYD